MPPSTPPLTTTRRLGPTQELTPGEERLEQLAGDYVDGSISRSEWRVAGDRLTARIARHRLSSNGRVRVLASLSNREDQLRARWQDADLTWRRAVVDAVVESVVVAPKGHRGGKRFDPGRVQITWRA